MDGGRKLCMPVTLMKTSCDFLALCSKLTTRFPVTQMCDRHRISDNWQENDETSESLKHCVAMLLSVVSAILKNDKMSKATIQIPSPLAQISCSFMIHSFVVYAFVLLSDVLKS